MTYEDLVLRDTTIYLDGNLYRRCTIERCRIVYSGGDPGGFDGCSISHCDWQLDGSALQTVRFISAVYSIPELRSIANDWIDSIRSGPPPEASTLIH